MFSRTSYVKNNAFFHQLVSIQNDQIEEKIHLNFILLITCLAKAFGRGSNKVENISLSKAQHNFSQSCSHQTFTTPNAKYAR